MLVGVLAGGHRIVYVMGNHDREFHFSAVQEAFRAVLSARAEADAIELDLLTFEPWFFHVPGEIYVEHGQQYDYDTSFRSIPRSHDPPQASRDAGASDRQPLQRARRRSGRTPAFS